MNEKYKDQLLAQSTRLGDKLEALSIKKETLESELKRVITEIAELDNLDQAVTKKIRQIKGFEDWN